jgi:8-oxo-dGTP pyrophosphatase MutT (NUDIX family)
MRVISEPIPQAAAIAVRAGRLCLITSSNGRRWIIPKGHCEPGGTAAESALQEAWEEAGLVGTMQSQPVGWYAYRKLENLYRVAVYLMHVTDVAAKWPESGHRRRRWVTVKEALEYLDHPELCKLLRALPGDLFDRTKKKLH